MPLRFFDKFNRNALPAALWEAKAGSGKLFVCTLDNSGNSKMGQGIESINGRTLKVIDPPFQCLRDTLGALAGAGPIVPPSTNFPRINVSRRSSRPFATFSAHRTTRCTKRRVSVRMWETSGSNHSNAG